MAAISPARKAAFAILLAVEHGKSHSDELLRGKRVAALSAGDRNLTTALVLGTLRWQLELDGQIRPLLKRPNAKLDAEVMIALRLGAFQLLHLDRIPAHAAISESVEIAKQAGHTFASAMVNAVLRKIAQANAMHRTSDIPIEPDSFDAYPAWMVQRWTSCYGIDVARAICTHGQNPPALAIRVDDAAEQELVAEGIRLEPGEVLMVARRVASGDVTSTAAFREGRARLQDEGSQLVAELAPRGSAILDCCAAPGGKTLILAERNPSARIVACEASAQRLAQMRERLESLGDRVECRLADATQPADDAKYDLVLADVPCSGTGTLGRNPEIRHRLRPEDLPRHAHRQKEILSAALRAIRPGGCVVYSTCSLEPEENEEVVAAALLDGGDSMRRVSVAARIAELRDEGILTAFGAERLQDCITGEGYLRLLPGVVHTDGFFVAILKRDA
jgi:16S rRNA (cytosine967-C5)-methyltransferase